ncbi:MAG: hypothetical protein F6K40_20750 [Okeania sp. SIO3I5]|uniref:hypothetical protein n=1 Tax=Okeania sp. SIO3I5 TaxID=2607805 RepID=UPI0013B90F5A|nr:hypothetical protein [Okeania sp. SIO3I5]NEQ38566.1 hypothetical protein [Okeania sp. SIO3I5]
MQKYYANLSPNLKLLENLINSIRGITEIEQAESDRYFQELVAIISVGLKALSMLDNIRTYAEPLYLLRANAIRPYKWCMFSYFA